MSVEVTEADAAIFLTHRQHVMRAGCIDLTVGQHGPRSADNSTRFTPPTRRAFVEKLARVSIKSGGQCASRGDDQQIVFGQQVTLRCEVATTGVRLADVVAFPDDLAIVGIDGIQENVFVREHADAEVSNAAFNHHTGAAGPTGDHFAARDQPFVGRSAAKFPNEFAAVGCNAINKSVIRTEKDFALPDCWSQSDWPTGVKRPLRFAGFGVLAVHLMVDRRTEENLLADRHDLEGIVEANAVAENFPLDGATGETRPCAVNGTGRGVFPRLLQRQFEVFGGRPNPLIAVEKTWPVGCVGRSGAGEKR